MSVTKLEYRKLEGSERFKVTYERRSFLKFISWWVRVNKESIGKDLVINVTDNDFENIIFNGKTIKL